MKSYSAYFARTDDIETATRIFGRVERIPDSGWLVAGYYPGAAPPADDVLWGGASLTRQKSEGLGEIIFLFADTSPDSLVYEHAREGALLRKLVWFMFPEREGISGWVWADGEREEWEARLFRPQRLPSLIEEERGIYEDRGEDALFPSREAEIRRVWEDCLIAKGSTIPRADGTVALLVEQHFGLKRP